MGIGINDITVEDFEEVMSVCELDRVKDIQSSWGNSYCYVTEEQIKELQEGKVLGHLDGEYGTFIILRKEGE